MTGARSWAIPALVVALICALGAGVVFLLRPRAPSPGPAQVAAQLIDQVDLTNLAALNEELPEGSKAVVMGGPAPLAAGAPESSTAPTAARPASPIPAPSRQVSPPGDQDEPHPVQTGEVLATETAGAAGAPPPPPEPAPAAFPPVGAVTRVEDGTALAEVLDGLPENYDVATAVRSQDRLLLAVAMPRSFYPTWNPALIVVTAVTGLLAALAVLLLSRQRDRPSTSDARPASLSRYPDQRDPYVQERLPTAPDSLGLPPPLARPTPLPRHPIASATTDGEGLASQVLAPSRPSSPPLNTGASALLAQQRTMLAERATLLRGLADLLVRLPDEYAWQAATLLEAAGARKVVPEAGAQFDPAVHRVIGTEPTEEAGFDDAVARTLRPGWRDRDQVLVPAHVVVYASAEQAEREPDDDL
jgi:hypothetical protein